MMGKVTLVGAGPGDPGLLTLRGLEAMREADVVVFDRLVSGEILQLIPNSVRRVNVGKESGNHPVPQGEINRILLDEALAGNNVVRLKGGDPFLFGRGGEELELLARSGVAFEVVPGITSALAAPAYAGIPVTHRDYCNGVHVVTAHAGEGKAPQLDFATLARLGGTLVFLMGSTAIARLAAGLIDAGMSAETPAAVVEHGTRPNQRKTLAALSDFAKGGTFESPAILVVGAVCELSRDFDWFSALPLKGRRVAVTRSAELLGRLSAMLRRLGAEVVAIPCIETEYLTPELPDFAEYEWLAFTSPTGVRAFAKLLESSGRDVRAIAALRLAAVGAATARELYDSLRVRADYVPERFNSDSLADGLAALGASRILHVGAESGSPHFSTLPVYRTITLSVDAELGTLDCVCFTGASTVRGFADSYGDVTTLRAACIGASTAAEAELRGFRNIAIAADATLESLCDAVTTLLKE
ncbi:MAG: uroporphyrinogen-III C-methyltransferase [Oscillospiraceae bacterium]|jgi:uroporphyrinogen III methyltransferase/synthase|nr:uroporphyrinogen-III C-methyltransferase [Oscillospiraceae bacterium]